LKFAFWFENIYTVLFTSILRNMKIHCLFYYFLIHFLYILVETKEKFFVFWKLYTFSKILISQMISQDKVLIAEQLRLAAIP